MEDSEDVDDCGGECTGAAFTGALAGVGGGTGPGVEFTATSGAEWSST